ncbi:MAG: DEAD/DEAH box helicase family protein [Treponema sp.]|jgi:superfamily II DNA or RNA helicase|nr:DEAD/DEAH box helicase family protein [Treponema sp.]
MKRYGVTPWGSWFIEVLDSYKMGARLDRGRTYANTGRVLSLSLNACCALAKVEGNYRPFYRVEILFPPLKEAEQVYQMIEEDPPLQARIAAGELPEAFLLKLRKKGINLIPRRWRDMQRSCNCPDYGDPCKHMAALYYIIAREIDADPHVLFRLRGMDLAARFGNGAVFNIAPPFEIKYGIAGKPAQGPLVLEEIPLCVELITAVLPSAPPFCDRDFAVVMAEFYHRCAHYRAWESDDAEEHSEKEHGFSRSTWTAICPNPAPGAKVFLDAEDINGKTTRYTLYEVFEHFVNFSSDDGTASYTFLFYLFKFLNLICSSGAFIPYVLNEPSAESDHSEVVRPPGNKTLSIIWRPFETLPPVPDMLKVLASHECGIVAGKKRLRERCVVDLLTSAFLNEWVKRRALSFGSAFNRFGSSEEFRELLNLFFLGKKIDVSSPARRSLPAAIDRWLSVLHINFTAYSYSITIKDMRQNSDDADLEFAILMDVITERNKEPVKTPLSKCRDLEALRAPTALSNYLPEIRDLTSRRAVRISEARLVDFLDSAAPLLTRLGITINLPKALAKELKPRLVIKGSSTGGSLKSYLDLNTLQDFSWQIAIGDEVMTPEEFAKLVKEKRALVRFRDGFVKMDPEELARLLKAAKDSSPDLNDFLKAHFSGDSVLAFDARKNIDNLFKEQNFTIPKALTAELRPYQKNGYNWVCSLLFSGFGCILADDMGLGKTVQSIAAVLRLKEEGLLNDGCLVIAPAALLNNWEKELSRFAPRLGVSRYHGSRRHIDRKRDVFLTTYQTAVRDAEKLKNEAFSMLLVDEAHLMKNAETRLSRTVKQLRSKYRLALSGTPVENRLEDLRSLFDFILPGYLGNVDEFKERYRVPIEVMRSREKAEALRKITAPFLLRRLKTDKKIIVDLPEKIVSNEYAVLEKVQAALYETVVSESIEKSEKSEPQERSALILSLLTSLKQICDHPRVFDKESPPVSELSGKAQLLLTLLGEILANREKTLVFSQYVETLDCLERIIKAELGEAALIYHGGLTQKTRFGIVERFQNDPAVRILLVSLRAGGLGLNLTAASRVIHYDLWYNPAVENQATDRAFRIGQERNVFVHRFITKNSFEEKIDAMISSKQELADMTVASGESWLARMNHDELKALFDR